MRSIKSNNSVKETADKIESFLNNNKVQIFLRLDHQENARKVDLKMLGAELIIFGNPALGTNIMQVNIDAAYDLPLKIAIVERSEGVFITYKDPSLVLGEYNFSNATLISKINSLLDNLVNFATS